MSVQEIIAAVLMLLGFVFMLISALGLFRFPDFYSRLHSTGIGDTLGCTLIIAGMMVLTGLKLITVKILLIPLILFLTSPMATNLIMSAAIHKHDYENYKEMRLSKAIGDESESGEAEATDEAEADKSDAAESEGEKE